MIECCDNLFHLAYTKDQLIRRAPCPPPWKVYLLFERGRRLNVSQTILDDISARCRRQLLRHPVPVKDKPVCVDECMTGTTAAVTAVVVLIILGILIRKIKSRRRLNRLPRVKKINPVLDLKNKIELSIITIDDDSISSSDSATSNEGFYATITDKMWQETKMP